jgi:uncharacterized lipoprotein YmbA
MIRVVLALGLSLLAGCAGKPQEPNYYLLRSAADVTTRELVPASDFFLGKVTIAPYIDQRGLLLQTADGDMRPARQHLWAEPVSDGIRLFLLKEISAGVGEDILPLPTQAETASINLRIDQLHGTNDGRARLVVYWWIDRQGELVSAHQFAEYEPLAADGYAALADAQRTLLEKLASQIADSINSARDAPG